MSVKDEQKQSCNKVCLRPHSMNSLLKWPLKHYYSLWLDLLPIKHHFVSLVGQIKRFNGPNMSLRPQITHVCLKGTRWWNQSPPWCHCSVDRVLNQDPVKTWQNETETHWKWSGADDRTGELQRCLDQPPLLKLSFSYTFPVSPPANPRRRSNANTHSSSEPVGCKIKKRPFFL